MVWSVRRFSSLGKDGGCAGCFGLATSSQILVAAQPLHDAPQTSHWDPGVTRLEGGFHEEVRTVLDKTAPMLLPP